jgi:hypothetical protein
MTRANTFCRITDHLGTEQAELVVLEYRARLVPSSLAETAEPLHHCLIHLYIYAIHSRLLSIVRTLQAISGRRGRINVALPRNIKLHVILLPHFSQMPFFAALHIEDDFNHDPEPARQPRHISNRTLTPPTEVDQRLHRVSVDSEMSDTNQDPVSPQLTPDEANRIIHSHRKVRYGKQPFSIIFLHVNLYSAF